MSCDEIGVLIERQVKYMLEDRLLMLSNAYFSSLVKLNPKNVKCDKGENLVALQVRWLNEVQNVRGGPYFYVCGGW